MSEKDEIKIVKLITSHCKVITPSNLKEVVGGYVVGDIFELVASIDRYYKFKK